MWTEGQGEELNGKKRKNKRHDDEYNERKEMKNSTEKVENTEKEINTIVQNIN